MSIESIFKKLDTAITNSAKSFAAYGVEKNYLDESRLIDELKPSKQQYQDNNKQSKDKFILDKNTFENVLRIFKLSVQSILLSQGVSRNDLISQDKIDSVIELATKELMQSTNNKPSDTDIIKTTNYIVEQIKKEKNYINYKENIESEVKEELKKVFDDEFTEKATLEILENEDGKIKVLCYTKNKEIMLEKDGKDWKVYQI